MTQPTAQSDYSRAYAQAAALYADVQSRPQSTDDLGATSTAAAVAILLLLRSKGDQLRQRWRLINPYDDAEVDSFAQEAGRITSVTQQAAARATAAAQTTMLRSLGVPVTVVPKVPEDVRSATPAGDVERRAPARVEYAPSDPTEGLVERTVPQGQSDTRRVYTRGAVTYRFRRSEGATHEQAQTAAEQRIESILEGNLQLARRLVEHQALEQARAVDLDRTIIGYRRIIHPEMSVGGVCGLCIAAADRTYKSSTLKAIHANCWCTVMPVFTDFDPGFKLNRKDLDSLYITAGGTAGKRLKRTRYLVEEHGELGPMLVPAKGSSVPYFKNYEDSDRNNERPADDTSVGGRQQPRRESAAAGKEGNRELAERHLPALRASLARLLAAGRSEDSEPVRYHRAQIAKFESYL